MGEKKRILIIDDEVDYITFLRDRLEYEGFEVDLAYEGEEGLEMIRGGSYDVILLDLMLPGIDGFEVLKRLSSESYPIIVVSAYGRLLKEEEKRIIGDAPFLRKPFDVEELLKRINEMGR